MKSSAFVLATLAALLAGCAVNPPASKYRPVDTATAAMLRDRDVRLLVRPTPDLVYMTKGDQATMTVGMLFGAVGGVIGATAAIEHSKARGRALMKENAIEDPTPLLSNKVRDLLAARYGSTFGDSGCAITVATDHWAVTGDGIVFNASVSIDDADRKGKTLALGQCRYRSASAPDGNSDHDLLANGAEGLKQQLGAALDWCVDEFRQRLFR